MIVIGADTFVVDKGKLVGKPKDEEDAKKILQSFSGREHEALTGFAIIDTKNNKVVTGCGKCKVKFRELSDEEINNYVRTGEPLEMAGAYGMMNKAAVLVDSVEGDFYSVIGLPLGKIYLALKEMGVDTFS